MNYKWKWNRERLPLRQQCASESIANRARPVPVHRKVVRRRLHHHRHHRRTIDANTKWKINAVIRVAHRTICMRRNWPRSACARNVMHLNWPPRLATHRRNPHRLLGKVRSVRCPLRRHRIKSNVCRLAAALAGMTNGPNQVEDWMTEWKGNGRKVSGRRRVCVKKRKKRNANACECLRRNAFAAEVRKFARNRVRQQSVEHRHHHRPRHRVVYRQRSRLVTGRAVGRWSGAWTVASEKDATKSDKIVRLHVKRRDAKHWPDARNDNVNASVLRKKRVAAGLSKTNNRKSIACCHDQLNAPQWHWPLHVVAVANRSNESVEVKRAVALTKRCWTRTAAEVATVSINRRTVGDDTRRKAFAIANDRRTRMVVAMTDAVNTRRHLHTQTSKQVGIVAQNASVAPTGYTTKTTNVRRRDISRRVIGNTVALDGMQSIAHRIARTMQKRVSGSRPLSRHRSGKDARVTASRAIGSSPRLRAGIDSMKTEAGMNIKNRFRHCHMVVVALKLTQSQRPATVRARWWAKALWVGAGILGAVEDAAAITTAIFVAQIFIIIIRSTQPKATRNVAMSIGATSIRKAIRPIPIRVRTTSVLEMVTYLSISNF